MEEVKSISGLENVGGETTFITNVSGIKTVFLLDDALESVIDFSTNLHGMSEAAGTSGENHKLLEGELITSVFTTIDNVEGRNRGNVFVLFLASELTKMSVKRDSLLSGTSSSESE